MKKETVNRKEDILSRVDEILPSFTLPSTNDEIETLLSKTLYARIFLVLFKAVHTNVKYIKPAWIAKEAGLLPSNIYYPLSVLEREEFIRIERYKKSRIKRVIPINSRKYLDFIETAVDTVSKANLKKLKQKGEGDG